jgi:hypothetical protein
VEYADVFGVPFDFTASRSSLRRSRRGRRSRSKRFRPTGMLSKTASRVSRATASSCLRRLTADFNDDSNLELTPDLVGPSTTQNSGPGRHDGHHRSLSMSPNGCSTPNGAIRARNRSYTCSANSSASPSSWSTHKLRYRPGTAAAFDIALLIDAVNLKHRLRDIETDCRYGLHDLAPPNRGGLNSTTSKALTCRWTSRPQNQNQTWRLFATREQG